MKIVESQTEVIDLYALESRLNIDGGIVALFDDGDGDVSILTKVYFSPNKWAFVPLRNGGGNMLSALSESIMESIKKEMGSVNRGSYELHYFPTYREFGEFLTKWGS